MTDPTEVNSSGVYCCQNHLSPLLKCSLILYVVSTRANIVTLCHPSAIPSCHEQPAARCAKYHFMSQYLERLPLAREEICGFYVFPDNESK